MSFSGIINSKYAEVLLYKELWASGLMLLKEKKNNARDSV